MSDDLSKDNAYLDKFRKDTGIWPPGRDMPRAYNGLDAHDVQFSAFRYWQKVEAKLARLQGIVDILQAAAHKVVLCFPDAIPIGEEDVEFNLPAYVINELYEAAEAASK